MATTEDQIKADLIALDFDNPSDLALYNKIAQAIGIPIDATVQEFTNSENRILNIIVTQRYGKGQYYTQKALAFQLGDDLIVDPVTFDDVYAVINPLNQIIAQAAFEDLGSGQLFLKVATLNAATGDLQALTTPQKAAFDDYFVNFELPGLPVTKLSLPPNVISFSAILSYLKTYNLDNIKANVKTALTAFRQAFPFDGEFFLGDLVTYIKQNVPGVRDFYAYNTALDGNPFAGFIKLPAGYFNYPQPYDTFLNNIVYATV